jgi:hypothetical protein
MHTDIRQNNETGRWEWEVSTYSGSNYLLIPVDSGCAATYQQAEQDAEKAKSAYLRWLRVRNF